MRFHFSFDVSAGPNLPNGFQNPLMSHSQLVHSCAGGDTMKEVPGSSEHWGGGCQGTAILTAHYSQLWLASTFIVQLHPCVHDIQRWRLWEVIGFNESSDSDGPGGFKARGLIHICFVPPCAGTMFLDFSTFRIVRHRCCCFTNDSVPGTQF